MELARVTEMREEVFVKATGRAIEKALNVGKWFEEKEAEYTVRVKTGSVLVVDDVVEDEEKKERELQKQQREEGRDPQKNAEEKSDSQNATSKSAAKEKKKRPASAISEDAELPETRTRWVKMVEVAVSLR
jgi:ribonuclease P/MRP protein subunit POP7